MPCAWHWEKRTWFLPSLAESLVGQVLPRGREERKEGCSMKEGRPMMLFPMGSLDDLLDVNSMAGFWFKTVNLAHIFISPASEITTGIILKKCKVNNKGESVCRKATRRQEIFMGFKKMDGRQHWVKQSGESCSRNSPGKGCSGNGSRSCPPSLGGDRGLNAGHIQTYRQCASWDWKKRNTY